MADAVAQVSKLCALLTCMIGMLESIEAIDDLGNHPDVCLDMLLRMRPLFEGVEPAFEVVLLQAEQAAKRD